MLLAASAKSDSALAGPPHPLGPAQTNLPAVQTRAGPIQPPRASKRNGLCYRSQNKASRMRLTASEIPIDFAQPSFLEKKKNMRRRWWWFGSEHCGAAILSRPRQGAERLRPRSQVRRTGHSGARGLRRASDVLPSDRFRVRWALGNPAWVEATNSALGSERGGAQRIAPRDRASTPLRLTCGRCGTALHLGRRPLPLAYSLTATAAALPNQAISRVLVRGGRTPSQSRIGRADTSGERRNTAQSLVWRAGSVQ